VLFLSISIDNIFSDYQNSKFWEKLMLALYTQVPAEHLVSYCCFRPIIPSNDDWILISFEQWLNFFGYFLLQLPGGKRSGANCYKSVSVLKNYPARELQFITFIMPKAQSYFSKLYFFVIITLNILYSFRHIL
jgi:hypothetical protein